MKMASEKTRAHRGEQQEIVGDGFQSPTVYTKSPGNGKYEWFWASVTKILFNDKYLGYT